MQRKTDDGETPGGRDRAVGPETAGARGKPAGEKTPGGDGLRNTLYQQRTRSSRRLTAGRRVLYTVLVPIALSLVRLVWRWSRVVSVVGSEHISRALGTAPSFVPVYWHQHQLFCVRHLLALRGAGVKLGFLISPSVDGELGAMLVRSVGGEVIRGSSSHTGARALRDYYQALSHDNVSPAITPDGPRGPPWKFKPGAVLLAQLSQRPIIPLAYAASRAWKIQWDRFVIPKPGARIAIAVGEPVYIPKGLDAAGLERHQADMESRLKALYLQAKKALE
ncbi:MAG: lysophospholipid acyltransferase family protein [Pseudomonadota bacterium]|nr:lysophospholipid acyltransferase family protein [Pseudomonadota bacterium]